MTIITGADTTQTTTRICDSQDHSGEDGWEKGNSFDNFITDLLSDKPGQGFTPGNGTVYVNSYNDKPTLVHEIAHEMQSRASGRYIDLSYKLEGLVEMASRLFGNDPYQWDLSKGWIIGYEKQDLEARARADEQCHRGNLLGCLRSPNRYILP